jgi:hypothetical protein
MKIRGLRAVNVVVTVGAALMIAGAQASTIGRALALDGQNEEALLASPWALAASNGQILVCNEAGNSITIFNANNGREIRTVEASPDGMVAPDAVTSAVGRLFVVNDGAYVYVYSEMTGRRLRVLHSRSYNFFGSDVLTSASGVVFVINDPENMKAKYERIRVVEFSASTYALVRTIWVQIPGVNILPVELTVDGSRGFISNDKGSFVTEFNTLSGSIIHQIEGAGYKFDHSTAIAQSLKTEDVLGANAVTEFSPSTTSVLKIVSASGFSFRDFDSFTSNGMDGFVSYGNKNAIDEFNLSSGRLIRIIH